MNLRKLKRAVYARMWHDLFYNRPIGQFLGTFRTVVTTPLPTVVVIDDLQAAFRQGIAEQAAKFLVTRIKDNVMVAEFDTREEALELVLKHARQKKAKLHVFHDGELVLFAENEILNA